MKANEAPDKIYVHVKGGKTLNTWNNEWIGVNDIEYVRKDTFIEMTCEFLKSYRQDILDGLGYVSGIINDKTIEDFRNYIKRK